ncbi:hypothetical protein GcM1_222054 [Golovinomyces cichoracearum]|uniref:Uncharacterized protein n=1 Tax=Golovinomyces cichoracearum TaxID=62708 RepID=A0A420IRE7_9PEZI|nr:hypothetical protein GcM1_222054 [Golovinomyces cichoracearum]
MARPKVYSMLTLFIPTFLVVIALRWLIPFVPYKISNFSTHDRSVMSGPRLIFNTSDSGIKPVSNFFSSTTKSQTKFLVKKKADVKKKKKSSQFSSFGKLRVRAGHVSRDNSTEPETGSSMSPVGVEEELSVSSERLANRSKNYRKYLEESYEKSDIDYFAYTPQNLFESQHAFWYANWTLSRQNDPRWLELGEWRLFAIDYFNTRNLDCGSFWMDCKDIPSLSEILDIHPDDREHARRVYFTSENYLIIRNYLKAIQSILDEVQLTLYGMLPEIIQVFTSQPDPSAQAACAMIGAVVDTLINVGVTAVTGMMSGTITSFYDKIKTNVITATHSAEQASRWYKKIITSKWIPDPVVKWLRNQDQFNAWGEITPISNSEVESISSRVAELFEIPKSGYPAHSKPELVPGLQKIKDTYIKTKKDFPWVKPITQMPATLRIGLRFNLQSLVKEHARLHIESNSLGGDGICSRFNGADVNNNAANINLVQGQLASVFPRVLESLSEVYEGIYNGSLREEGRPSWLATSMLNHNWAEEKSYLERLRHGGAMKQQVMRAFTLNIASQVSAKDGSYMKCTLKSWATEKCDRMAHAKPNDEAALAYFCPRPEIDPGLICQVGRWAFSAEYSHETPWPALLKIENFFENRFELTRSDVLNAAYDHYQLHGNDLQVDWNTWFLGSLSSLNSLTMPVCMHDGLAMNDNIVHGPGHKGKGRNSWAVPNACGLNGTETERFFFELGFLEGTAPWNSRNKYERWAGGGTNEFYHDRLVRANRDMFGTNPFLRYTTMCNQHIRFAEHEDWKKYDAMNLLNHARVHKGRDRDCDLVLAASVNMTSDEGNRWFCQKHLEYGMDYGHTVFSRESWKVEISRIPRDWVENHKHDCRKWLKLKGKNPKPPVPAIPGVPRPETGLRWLQKQELKKIRDKKKAAKAKNKILDAEAERAFKASLKSMTKKEAKIAKKRHKQELKEVKELREKIANLGVKEPMEKE